jgi:peptide/nickel transport system substrate-binding protein
VKRKFVWTVVSCLMILSLVMASCGQAEEEAEAEVGEEEEEVGEEEQVTEEEEALTPSGENWWDYMGEPQYGGTITLRLASDITSFDPYYHATNLRHLEHLAGHDWTLDREIFPYNLMIVPLEYRAPWLAESWETSDQQTITVHIRKGVHWQDIPPVNGREFTAYDVEYKFHRLLGLGSGYTEPSPHINLAPWLLLESVTAVDKYTVVFQFNKPSVENLEVITEPGFEAVIEPREAIEEWGDVRDWKHAIGTGAFMMESYVPASSITYVKNPNYWGYDERHPENKLPYADKLRELIISDKSTMLAGVRTGQIDLVMDLSWEDAAMLKKTNPDLMQIGLPTGFTRCLTMRCDKEPFSDIRVRRAMQMAIDLPTIAETYYGGIAKGIPYGLIGPVPGYHTPFDEWPQEVKEGYTYNPEGAKQLLADAGYPDGFITNCIASSVSDIDFLEILQNYLMQIDIDMQIVVMDNAGYTSVVNSGNLDEICFDMANAFTMPVQRSLSRGYTPFLMNYSCNNDPVFNDLYERYVSSLDGAERQRLCIEADMYAIEQQWRVATCPVENFHVFQPYLKSYSGIISQMIHFYAPRWWIAQN